MFCRARRALGRVYSAVTLLYVHVLLLVFTSQEVVIMTSGAFESLRSEQDGDVPSLKFFFFLTLLQENEEQRMFVINL